MENLKRFYKSLETAKRADGTEFICLTDDAPQWAKELARKAHGDMMPDDTRYDMILECVEAMLNYDEIDIDHCYEIADDLVDIYNGDRLKWLATHLGRAGYCDDAQENELIADNATLFERIGAGQYQEYLEILSVLVATFEEMEGDE